MRPARFLTGLGTVVAVIILVVSLGQRGLSEVPDAEAKKILGAGASCEWLLATGACAEWGGGVKFWEWCPDLADWHSDPYQIGTYGVRTNYTRCTTSCGYNCGYHNDLIDVCD